MNIKQYEATAEASAREEGEFYYYVNEQGSVNVLAVIGYELLEPYGEEEYREYTEHQKILEILEYCEEGFREQILEKIEEEGYEVGTIEFALPGR